MKLYRNTLIMVALGAFAAAGCDDDTAPSTGGGEATGGAAGGAAPGFDVPAPAGMQPAAQGDAPAPATPGDDGMMPAAEPQLSNIVETAVAAGNFSSLAGALTDAGLVGALQGPGPFTVFAPTDEAFASFEAENPGVLASLSVEQLTEILTYHVIEGAAVRSVDLVDGELAPTLAGPVLAVDLGDEVKINDAVVTTADIEASNGVIHVVDRIIMPPGDIIEVATAAGNFSQLAAALGSAGLIETLQGEGPFTVFAPTDAAFQALAAVPEGDALSEVLLYHVVPGIAGPNDLVSGGAAVTASGAPVVFDLSQGARINDANISVTNVVASNGVIHVIDAVILPPDEDIVQTAIDAGVFNSLAGALTDAGLVETLQGPGPFTVFAPTDDAFAALPAVPTGDALSDVLLYHVVDGAVASGNLSSGTVQMLSGGMIQVDLSAGVRINQASVTSANILASNGIIHIVDQVLLPQ